MTAGWSGLPQPVRVVVERRVGPVVVARDVEGGQNCHVSAVLHGAGRPVFLKGVEGVSRQMRWLRNEGAAGRLAAGVAPAVLFAEDVGDWLVVGFEYVPGRAASLAPGSADLPRVAATVEKISALPAPGLRTLRDRWSAADCWEKFADAAPAAVAGWDVGEMSRRASPAPALVDGDRLVHTDLHADQFLVGADGGVHAGSRATREAMAWVLIDWGWPAAGAGWVDAAFLVLRLIAWGHRPEEAEAWARSLRCWSGVDGAALDAFSAYVAGLWSYRAATGPAPGAERRARTAREYAAWRLAVPAGRGCAGVGCGTGQGPKER